MKVPPRTLVVWCPNWPVVATGHPMSEPVAVIAADRVVSASLAARGEGIRPGLRRREAQSRCPQLIVYSDEPSRSAKAFEPVVATVEALAPRVEVLSPGSCAVLTRGPSRYFGGDEALVHHLTMLVSETLRDSGLDPTCLLGVADGMFAASLAAQAGMILEPGSSRSFLAAQPVDVLSRPELVDLLHRLGIRTLGDFAALPASDVLGRFGNDGATAHRLARGLDEVPFIARIPAQDLAVSLELDPPVQRVDTAAFAARSMADKLHSDLQAEGLACSCLVIEAETEHGETLRRVWRSDGRLTGSAIAERVRWQLDGWLTDGGGDQTDRGYEPTGGLTLLRLTPEGLLPDNGHQLGFWGGSLDANERTARALARVQGLLGEDAVVTPVIGGGRSPAEQVRLVPWGTAREPSLPGFPSGLESEADTAVRSRKRKHLPEVPVWPGRLPVPAPATVHDPWLKARLLDVNGQRVGVHGRGQLSAEPAYFSLEGKDLNDILAWTGPWLLDERWWDGSVQRRCARLQILAATRAYLVTLEKGEWFVEAEYD